MTRHTDHGATFRLMRHALQIAPKSKGWTVKGLARNMGVDPRQVEALLAAARDKGMVTERCAPRTVSRYFWATVVVEGKWTTSFKEQEQEAYDTMKGWLDDCVGETEWFFRGGAFSINFYNEDDAIWFKLKADKARVVQARRWV